MHTPLPLRLALSFLLNVGLVFAMDALLPEYFRVFGSAAAYVIIGALLTLLNLFVRPVLKAITFPLHLFMSMFALILVNGIFLWLVYHIVLRMNPDLVLLEIGGGIGSWLTVSIVFGMGNWVMKHALR